MEEYIDFEQKFEKLIEGYRGTADYDLIKDYSNIFSTVLGVSSDKNTDECTKMIMNCVISYFVCPNDVMPEKEHGIEGYLDDFYLCIFALRQALEYNYDSTSFLIKKYWKLEEDFENYLSNKFYVLSRRLNPTIVASISLSSGINFAIETAKIKKNPRTYMENKTKDLQRKIEYLIFLFFNNRQTIGKEERRCFEKTIFETEAFSEFVKKIEAVSKVEKEYFSNCKSELDDFLSLEEGIKQLKIKKMFENGRA